LTLIGS